MTIIEPCLRRRGQPAQAWTWSGGVYPLAAFARPQQRASDSPPAGPRVCSRGACLFYFLCAASQAARESGSMTIRGSIHTACPPHQSPIAFVRSSRTRAPGGRSMLHCSERFDFSFGRECQISRPSTTTSNWSRQRSGLAVCGPTSEPAPAGRHLCVGCRRHTPGTPASPRAWRVAASQTGHRRGTRPWEMVANRRKSLPSRVDRKKGRGSRLPCVCRLYRS